MKSKLKKMGIVTGDGQMKEITKKSCANCEFYHKFSNAEYMGDCTNIQRTVMMNGCCGCYKAKEKKEDGSQL